MSVGGEVHKCEENDICLEEEKNYDERVK